MSSRYGWYACFFPDEFSPRYGAFADSKSHYRRMMRADGIHIPSLARVERMGDR